MLTEVDAASEMQAIEINPSKSQKTSPKSRLFINKKDRSRSNSSGLNVRRFSTDSILGERMDTIGRRLSRDITNSPPDLTHRFETFGKGTGANKFDTFSGNKTKIPETNNKFDTFAGNKSLNVTSSTDELDQIKPVINPKVTHHSDDEKPPLPIKMNKKHLNRRTPLSMDMFEKEKKKSELSLNLLSLKERLAPPMCQIDISKAVLRDRLHEELRAKYGANRTTIRQQFQDQDTMRLVDKNMMKVVQQHQQQQQQQQQQKHHQTNSHKKSKHNHQRSLDSLDRKNNRPTPSPRRTKQELDVQLALPSSSTTNMNSFNNPKPSAPLGKLSKEDLLILSQSSETEIHEFLNGSKKSEPP